ncbi:glycoside hydrolase family 3 N-terminal domain-containing protein [Microlunatus speluncae]|uniref:glycoside hydrolase family 3 N-terminal domain-containing protein n=1 Tax=Microlunatus speluncae TaxID=2594267 RepID=UPI00126629DF|nr:glycoside hydrolase family 3 N-terminal domain-containing protein [Microlunatus speluncae]
MTAGTDPVEELLGRLSLREKVGQLNVRLHGWTGVERRGDGYVLTEAFHAEVERWGGLGGLYGVFRSDAWSGRGWQNGIRPEDRPDVAALVTDAVRAKARHGVAPLLIEEAPHGHQSLGQTLFPVNLAAGAAWDPELTAEAAAAMGTELRRDGVHVALISGLDLLRDPRWGRSEECFGEDPRLAAALTAAQVRGLAEAGVGSVIKHFAAQGEGLGGRNGHSAVIGPQDLAELHLPAARAGIEAGAVGVMAAYNDIDGIPCCANPELLTGLLRDDWGFDGIVLGDGLAIDRLAGQTGSLSAAARSALIAGVDQSLWDTAYTLLEDVVAAEPALEHLIDRSCRRVLRLKHRFGLLGGLPPADPIEPGPVIIRDPAVLSRQLATRSLVLLDAAAGVLPAIAPGRLAVVGPNADSVTCLLGDYVPPLRPGEARTVREALAERRPVVGPEGIAEAGAVICVLGGTSHRAYSEEFADNGAAGGLTAATCGEGVDVADLELPGDQLELLRRLRAEARGPVISVVIMGRPHVLTEVIELSDATVLAFYPGPYGADAIADLLTGVAEPVGRLPITLPSATGVVPVRYNDRLDPAGVYVDRSDPVLRPFGFGLGFRSAPVTGLTATAGPDRVEVAVRLANESDGTVPEVIQVYGRRTGGPRWPRVRELLAFRRVDVPPGGTLIDFSIPADEAFAGPAGTTMIMVGEQRAEVARLRSTASCPAPS